MENLKKDIVLKNNIVDIFESIEELFWDMDDIEQAEEEDFEQVEYVEDIRYYESDERDFDEEFLY